MIRLLEFFGLGGSEIGRFLFGRNRRGASGPSQLVYVCPKLELLETRVVPSVNTGNAVPYWGNGHYYAYTKEDNDWEDARDHSKNATLDQLGTEGYLASITSSGENDFIVKYSYKGQKIPKQAFIGGSDSTDRGTSEGIWMWKGGGPDQDVKFRENGKNIAYTNWNTGEPNNKDNQDYLVLRTDGKWDDTNPDNGDDGYVTEWGRSGVEFTAGFADLGTSNTLNGQENGAAAKMTISFDRKVPNDYINISDDKDIPLIDIPITFTGTATAGTDYDMKVSGGSSYFKDGKLYVLNTQTVTLTFTPKNNNTWQGPRTIKATLGSDGNENIYGINANATSQVWIYDDEPLLSLGQGAYQFIRAPFTSGSSQSLPASNTSFSTSADTLIFDTSGIDESESSLSNQGFYDSFAMRWETYVRIPETGNYTFRTTSDDGHKLTVKRNDSSGTALAAISNWSDGSKSGSTPAISLNKGDVVWVQFDMYEKTGTASARLLWDRPDGSGGTTSNQVIPASSMFLSRALAAGVNRTESATSDTRALGFQLFSNKSSSVDLNVKLASTSETSNSTVDTSFAQRRVNSGVVGDDYAIWDDASAGSQIGTSLIGINDSYATTVWKPDQTAGSLANVKNYYVQVLTDSYAEATESIALKLGSNTGYGVSNDSQSVSIADSPFVLKVRAGQNPREGAGNEGDLGWFTITTGDRPAPAGMRVKYAITGGTATRNSDFTAPQATLSTTSYSAQDLVVIPTGATEAKIFIAALADAIREGDETLVLELRTNVEQDNQKFTFQRYNVDASAKQATLTIRDSEAFEAAVVTTPADRTGQSTVRARLTDGSQVASFDVHVTSQPTSDVLVTLTTTSGSLSARQLTFTASNWTQPQRVTLTGLGTNQATNVQLTSTSSDSRYSGKSTQQRVVPSNWSSELELSLWEGGTMLAAQPAASVVAIDSSEGPTSRFGFELNLGAVATTSQVELFYTLAGGNGLSLEGSTADVRHSPEATYRPLVLANSGSGDAAFANLGSFTTVSDAGELSAQAWVRRDKAEGGDTVFEFSNANGQHQIWLGFFDSSNRPRLQVRSSSGAILAQMTSDVPLALNEWNHLAFSIDKNRIASLYVNGDLVGRQTLSSGLSRLARSSNLLGLSLRGDRLDGALRGVAIWNAARTQDEIRASMVSDAATGDGLVSSLPLNNSLANGVSSAPPVVLSSNSSNTAAFATVPIFGLRLAAGANRAGVPLVVLNDLTAENDETLTLTLVDSGLYSLGGSSGTATAELGDDDQADVEFLAAWSNLDDSSSGWTSTGRFTVSENDQAQNAQTRLGIRLTSRPTDTVTLRLKSNTVSSGDIRTALASNPGATVIELVFTPDNWDQVQELLLQGTDDAGVDGDIERPLGFTITTTDTFYKALAPSVTVLVLDDDTYTAKEDLAAVQNTQAPIAQISAPTQSNIEESGSDSAEFTITLSQPAAQDTLVFFDLEQSNRQLNARDFIVTPSQNAQALAGLARLEAIGTGTETARVDVDGISESSSSFSAAGQTGDFTTTWSGYVAIPETGSYTFSVSVRGGVRLSLDGRTVIDQWIDSQATWSTDTLQLNRGDFVALTLDYRSFSTAAPAVALQWERPRNNGSDTVTETIPAEAFSRVDGIHLLIAAGSTSATVVVRGLDDSIDEDDETLVARLLAARGVELVVKSQNDATGGSTQLELALGITDRETVTLAAGTVLDLGRSVDTSGSKGSTVVRFTLRESVTLHRDRTGRVTGNLAWVDQENQTSLSGSVVDLVASVQTDLYQVLDRSVMMTLTAPLAIDSDSGTDRYLASLELGNTNRSSVELAPGTKLVYRNDSTGDTATLVLVNSLTLQSGQAVASVPVRAETVTLGLDLTSSASPLVGLTSRVDLPAVATLTISDDDAAGLLFFLDTDGKQAVDESRVPLVEMGTSLTRFVRLKSQPNDSVTVYLETSDTSEARLQTPGSSSEDPTARIALTFTPENWNKPQAFRIVPIDDRLVDGSQNVEIHSRTTSSDSFYAIRAAGVLPLSVGDNDTSGLKVELQQSSIAKAGNGFINLSLTAQPTANVEVTLSPSDRQFTINDRSVGRSETIVFTPENWSTLQTVGLYAVDDNAVEDISTSSLTFATKSADARFHSLAIDTVSIVITDNDLPTATLERISDGAEEGKPGRFRIRLSDATASSVGSKGLVVNYAVTAVDLDSSLPYGTTVSGRLGKIAQTPTTISGTVRIPPGQTLSDVLVVPIDDFLADSTNKSITVALSSGEGYTVSADSSRTTATVKIINNDVAGILVMTSGERVFVKESGSAATYQLALTSEPKSNVTVTITEKVASGASRQLGTSSTAFSTTVTFTRDNWFTPQQISVRAYDDYKIEDGSGGTAKTGIHATQLSYSFASSDTDYNTASHTGDSAHFTNFVQSVDVLDFELADTTATSMQSSLTSLQEGIDSLSLPMVGSLTGKTGQGLRKFIVNLSNSIRQVGTPTPSQLSRLITRDIAAALGVSEDAISVNLSMKDTSTTNPAVVVRFGFSDAYTVFSVPLASDFGLPGLGFQTEGTFDASFSYDAGLELVFPRSGDIYLNTADDKTFVTANFNAGLSENFRLTGGLGFMQLDAVNQPSVNENVQIGDEPASTELDVSFELFVNGGAGEDGSLTFTELTTSDLDLEEVFQYSLSGNAAMSFGVTTSVNGSAAIPSFKFDLSALLPLFDYSNQEQADEPENATTFYFDNIRLDLGSYITDMLSPIVDGLDDILKPLYPLVDALYKDTKIFATVGLESTFDVDDDGKTSTIDLAKWFAGFYATIKGEGDAQAQRLKKSVDDTVKFLDMLKGVMDLVRDLERLSDEDGFYVSFGSYELEAWKAGDDEADPAKEEVDEDAESLEDDTKEQADKGGKDEDGKSKNAFAKVMDQLDELGITIPLIEEPANAIKLLFGQDVSLFEWRLPTMGMSSEIDKTFPIYGGIEGVIEGGYEVKAHLGFGFDTFGLSQWRKDGFAARSSWKVFNGFYVADLDKNGKDIAEFTMDASMGAGLGYSARVVRADITGGLEAAASFDLLDEGEIAGTSDGKIRGREITDRISNPLSLFELSGELIAYVKSRVQIGVDLGFYSIWRTVWERRLAEIPIFRFGIGGRYGSGTVSNGHLAGTTIFFDANFNGRIDSLEPVAISDAEGHFDLEVDLRTFDTNRNGRIDDQEGRLVVFGGVDTTMNMPLALPFVAPLGSMVTPLTTIYSLTRESGVAQEEVDAFLRRAFGLGQFDYLNQDPLRTLQEANSFADSATRDALATYLAHIRLHVMGDLVTGATQNLLPDLVPGNLAAELEMLKGMLPVLLEKPDNLTVEDYLGEALHKVWLKLNPESDPTVTNMVAKVADLVSRASREVATRLDRLRADAFRTGASPAELLEKIHELKEKAFKLFRGELHGISAGLYRITDAEELDRAVTNRLQAVDSAFLEIPTSVSLVTANPSGQYTPNQPVVLFADVVSISGESAPTGSVEFYLRGPAGGPDRKIGTAELSPLPAPNTFAARATFTANHAFDGNKPFTLGSHTVYALYVPPSGDVQSVRGYAVSESMSVGIVVQAGYEATRLNAMPLYDTDSVFGTAQKSRSHALVTGIFQGALGRMPGSMEADDWARRMDAGTLTPEMLTTAIHQSTEYLTKAVRSLYTQHLKREADDTGLRGFLALLRQGGTLGQVSAMILGSPEYRAAFADDRSWINGVYRSVLGRDADASGLENWIKKLAAGSNHAEVAQAIVQSAEGTANAIDAVYALYFGRNADTEGKSAWTAVAQEKGLTFALSRILSSEESLFKAGKAVLPR